VSEGDSLVNNMQMEEFQRQQEEQLRQNKLRQTEIVEMSSRNESLTRMITSEKQRRQQLEEEIAHLTRAQESSLSPFSPLELPEITTDETMDVIIDFPDDPIVQVDPVMVNLPEPVSDIDPSEPVTSSVRKTKSSSKSKRKSTPKEPRPHRKLTNKSTSSKKSKGIREKATISEAKWFIEAYGGLSDDESVYVSQYNLRPRKFRFVDVRSLSPYKLQHPIATSRLSPSSPLYSKGTKRARCGSVNASLKRQRLSFE